MKKPEYLKHPVNGRILPWSEILARRLIPCDSNGNPLTEDRIEQSTVDTQSSTNSSSKTWDLGDPKQRKEYEQSLLGELNKTISEHCERKKLPYDGVMGVLPDWIHVRDHARFEEYRTLLLDNYSRTEVLKLLELWQEYFKSRIPRKIDPEEMEHDPSSMASNLYYDSLFSRLPTKHLEAIDFLVVIRNAVYSGPEEGIKTLAGKGAARGYKLVFSAREGGKAKGKNFLQERERVRKFAERIILRKSRKLSKRQLALLVVSEIYPDLKGEDVRKKADVIRHWLD